MTLHEINVVGNRRTVVRLFKGNRRAQLGVNGGRYLSFKTDVYVKVTQEYQHSGWAAVSVDYESAVAVTKPTWWQRLAAFIAMRRIKQRYPEYEERERG